MNLPKLPHIFFLTFLCATLPSFIASQTIHTHNSLQNQIAQSHCDGTLHTDLCVSTLSKLPELHKKSMSEVLLHMINVTESDVLSSESTVTDLQCRTSNLSPTQRQALADCMELLDETMDELITAYNDMWDECSGPKHRPSPARKFAEIQTYLSAVMTNQFTCLEGFSYGSNRTIRKYIQPGLLNISHHASNSLAILKKTQKNKKHKTGVRPDERDLEEVNRVDHDGFPRWLNNGARRLLQEATGNTTKVDLIVAKDGTGNFTTIGEAVAAAPNKTATRFVIYIKAGHYYENVEVDKKKTNIMFLGDGMGITSIKGNRNVIDGSTTFNSATLAVVGNGFLAKGITVENYAGPEKHQAVALRSGSDLSAFYQCSFIAYQDTLYTHSLRQFYRECDVYGTVDFIFGNAAVVFQKCNLYARLPLANQKNMYTAQGRQDPNQNTGISIMNSKIAAAGDLAANKTATKSYLGRPWKEFSRTVIMFSYIDDVVDPAGWLEWAGDFALSTLFYAEYNNRGPGANTTARVKWPGYRVLNNTADASPFTVGNFIQGGEWLPSYGIPFYLNLTS